MRRAIPTALRCLVVSFVALGACGGSGSDGEDEAGAAPDECREPPFEVELRVAGDGPNRAFRVEDAAAVRKLDGRAYTVYLTDYQIDRDEPLAGQLQEPPPGSTTVQTGLDVFNAEDASALPILESGDVGRRDWDSGELAALLDVFTNGEDETDVDTGGMAEIRHVDDASVCIRADLRSESGSQLLGTYRAEIVEDL